MKKIITLSALACIALISTSCWGAASMLATPPSSSKSAKISKTRFYQQLHNAIINKDLEMVSSLIEEHSLDVNTQDKNKNTFLHHAAISGDFNIVAYLIEQKANVNQLNAQDETPLHHAAISGDFNIVAYLIENGANIEQTNSDEETAQDCAANDEIADFLLCVPNIKQNPKIVNLRNHNGQTLLHYGASKGYTNFVDYLIEKADAQVNVLDNKGYTSLDLAIIHSENPECIELLRDHGALQGGEKAKRFRFSPENS